MYRDFCPFHERDWQKKCGSDWGNLFSAWNHAAVNEKIKPINKVAEWHDVN